MARIGIFSGSFDPIHKGHIAFALQAIDKANLDKVYILIERKPPRKPGITHPHHRIEMVKLAVRPHAKIEHLELPGNSFRTSQTLPRLRKKFPEDKLVMLVGSDLLEHMPSWPEVEHLLREFGLVVGARGNYEVSESLSHAQSLPRQPQEITILDSIERDLSSRKIREAFMQNTIFPGVNSGLLDSVYDYAKANWLYEKV